MHKPARATGGTGGLGGAEGRLPASGESTEGRRAGCASCRDDRDPAQPQPTAPRPSLLSPPRPRETTVANSQKEKEHPPCRCFPHGACFWSEHTQPSPKNQPIRSAGVTNPSHLQKAQSGFTK